MDRDIVRYCCDLEIMGYHVYQDIWEAEHGEILLCFRETENAFDPFAIYVKKDAEVAGHVPRKIVAICFIFAKNSAIHCEVTEQRRYSQGISQGGLESPCCLTL